MVRTNETPPIPETNSVISGSAAATTSSTTRSIIASPRLAHCRIVTPLQRRRGRGDLTDHWPSGDAAVGRSVRDGLPHISACRFARRTSPAPCKPPQGRDNRIGTRRPGAPIVPTISYRTVALQRAAGIGLTKGHGRAISPCPRSQRLRCNIVRRSPASDESCTERILFVCWPGGVAGRAYSAMVSDDQDSLWSDSEYAGS